MNNTLKLIIGFITYGKSTARYLPYFLSGLENQIFKDFKILVIDNSEAKDNDNAEYIKKNYPEIEIEWPGSNIGFAKAYNRMINRAIEMNAKYFLVINPDIILEPDAILKLVNAMDNNDKIGSVCPKIRQFHLTPQPPLLNRRGGKGGEVKKTNIIDSCGIQLKAGLRFIDIGQGQVDKGQFDKVEIIGPSGAAAMYRISALQKVKQDGQYFNEAMFMYKEDCDLAYRLFLANFKSKCVTKAIIYHDRTAEARGESDLQVALNRRRKSRQVKKWSYLNQQIIFIKYWHWQNWQNKVAIIWREIKMLVFILLFEQYLLGQFKELWRIRKKIKIYK